MELQRFFEALGSTKNHAQMLENSRMTQTDQEIAGSERFSRSLLDSKSARSNLQETRHGNAGRGGNRTTKPKPEKQMTR